MLKQFLKRIPLLPELFRLGLRFVRWLLYPRLGVLHQHPARLARLPDRYFRTAALLEPAPKISLVTPSYNYADFIERTIGSVLHQGYPNLEYIVQDGASTDATLERIEPFRAQLTRFESCKDDGQSHAINLGFQHSTGEIMAYLNADDVLLPGTLHYIANYFSSHPQVDVIYGHRLIIDENDNIIGEWILPPHDDETLRWADYVPQETLFWRRRIWDKVGAQVDESFRFAMDWDLLLRFQQAGAVFARLPRLLAAFRVHERQKTSAQLADIGRAEVARLRLRTLGRAVMDQTEISRHIHKFLLKSVWHHHMHITEIQKNIMLARLQGEQKPAHWYARESIYFYSVHKAGTALFTHILRQANELTHLDYETMIFDNQPPATLTFEAYGKLYGVFRINGAVDRHPGLNPKISSSEFVKDKTVVSLVRDPRDVLVSTYYSFGFSHVESPNPQMAPGLHNLRTQIQSESLDEFAIRMAPDVLKRFEGLYTVSQTCKHGAVLKYEDLIEHFDNFMCIFDRYISIPAKHKRDLYTLSRPRATEDPSAHKRSGKPGQYRQKLKPETIHTINQILRPVLEHFNYPLDDVSPPYD